MKRVLTVCSMFLAAMSWADIDFEHIPDTKPYANRVYGIRSVKQTGATTLRVVLGATATDAMKAIEAWRIVSDTDPNYAYEKFVRPVAVDFIETKTEFPYPQGRQMSPNGTISLDRSVVDLQLPTPMKKGFDYAAVAYGQGNQGNFCVTAALTASRVGSPDGDEWASRIVGLRKVSNIGDGKILCEFGAGYSEQGGNQAANWTVTVNGTKRPVRALGRRTKLDFYKTVGWPFGGVLISDVYLDIGDALKDGDKVVVSVSDAVTCGERSAAFTFDSRKAISRALQANQIGYLTDGAKKAYVGCWMGSMPDKEFKGGVRAVSLAVGAADVFGFEKEEEQTFDDGKSEAYHKLKDNSLRLEGDQIPFALIEEKTGKVAHKGILKLTHNAHTYEGKASGESNVWEADFTEFTTTGRYFISVPGVGRSLSFDISPKVYRKPFHVQAQGIYCQRCGIEMDPKLSGGWKRIACHVAGVVPTTEKRYMHHAFGNFPENMVMQPNPDKAGAEAKKQALLNTAVKNAITKNPNGIGLVGKVPNSKTGFTVIYSTKRDNSFGGDNWSGSLFSFSSYVSTVIQVDNGYLKLQGSEGYGFGRYGDNKWDIHALTFVPTGKTNDKGKQLWTATWYVNGKLEASTTRDYGMGEFCIGSLKELNAEGTSFKDVYLFNRVLTTDEMALATGEVADTVPVKLMIKGGHHDAGDYNPRSHMDVAQRLMELIELQPGKFTDNQLNVPEHNNGIPDVMDEALWQLRLWVGLQDKDGSVRNGTESWGDPHFFQTVELDDKGDYAWEKDSFASYQAAGAFAQASRILKKCGKEKQAAGFLKRAEMAYEWAVANPPTDMKNVSQIGTYTVSIRAYAAASLYHTTGEAKYHDDFKANCPWLKNPKAELSSWGKYDMTMAGRQYLLLPENLRDPELWKNILGVFKMELDMFNNGSRQSPYKFLRNPYAPITWGTGAYQNNAVNAGFYYVMTGDKAVRDLLIITCDNTLGANPMSISWITGLGERTMRCPLHNCRYRPDGLPVDGLQSQGPMQKGEGYSYVQTVYPRHGEYFASLHSWVDTYFTIVMTEPTVNNMVNTMFVFGLLYE